MILSFSSIPHNTRLGGIFGLDLLKSILSQSRNPVAYLWNWRYFFLVNPSGLSKFVKYRMTLRKLSRISSSILGDTSFAIVFANHPLLAISRVAPGRVLSR